MLVQKPPPKKKWELTPEAFARLLACLDDDPEIAGEKYVFLEQKLVRFFEWNHAREAGEMLAVRTLDVAARKLEEGEQIHNLNAYCCEVARRILKESFKEPAMVEWEEIAPTVTSPHANQDETYAQEIRLLCLEQCLHKLPPESRALLAEFLGGAGRDRINRRQALAERLGIARNALGNRVQRLLAKLEHCINRCLPRHQRE